VSGLSAMSDASPARPTERGQVRFGNCVLDLDTRLLYVDGREAHITPKAYELLMVLTEHAPKALTKSDLLERLWPKTYVSEDALARLVADVRTAIGDSARHPKWIRTIHGFGYAFTVEPTMGSRERVSTLHTLTWAGHEFRLSEGENIIGRDPDVAVPINSLIVSRRHARIIVNRDSISIEDLASKNGTLVRGKPVSGTILLQTGDVIQIGDFELVLHVAADVPTLTKQG
jgi:DNA-binding winged helix-turn-helix (wHTH) protein